MWRFRESSVVKSSQVKSSQISMAAAPAAFGAPAGARDREGAARRNWHGWIALSRGFIHIVFVLIIAAPHVTNFVPFQEVYCMAMQPRSRPTTGAIGVLRKGCSDGPRRR